MCHQLILGRQEREACFFFCREMGTFLYIIIKTTDPKLVNEPNRCPFSCHKRFTFLVGWGADQEEVKAVR